MWIVLQRDSMQYQLKGKATLHRLQLAVELQVVSAVRPVSHNCHVPLIKCYSAVFRLSLPDRLCLKSEDSPARNIKMEKKTSHVLASCLHVGQR